MGGSTELGAVLFGTATRLRFAATCSVLPAPSSHTGFTYSHIPSLPPSRPKPDSRYPPNPDAASNRLVQLIQTTPALIFGATSSARLMFSVHTDRKSTRLNSSHGYISYAVFCLKKKKCKQISSCSICLFC